jgi:PAS domain S-box-containing protein
MQHLKTLLLFASTAGGTAVIAGAMRTAADRRHPSEAIATICEAFPEAVLLADRRGRIRTVNERAVKLFDRPRETLIGAPVDSLLPERLRHNHALHRDLYAVDPRARAMWDGLDLPAQRGDGEEFVVDVNISPIEVDGEVLTIATVRDRTASRALHAALADSRLQQAILEQRAISTRVLHVALESTTDSVVVFDRTWRFTYLNDRAAAQLAGGRALIGEVLWQAFPALRDSPIGIAYRTAMDNNVPTRADGYFAASDAQFDAHAYPSAEGLTVFFRDVTEERRLAAAQAESDALLRLFIDRTPAAIAMFDTGMRYLAASRRFMLDYQLPDPVPATLIGRSHYDVFPDLPAPWRDIHQRVLGGETLSAAEDPFPRASGRTDWMHWEMAPWRHADGTVGGAVLFSEIVTHRVQADASLRQMTEDLTARLRENERLLERLQAEVSAREAAQSRAAHAEQVQALGQLAGGIAHDFNNVLQVVKDAATLIERRRGGDPSIARLAGLAREAAQRGGSITRRLLAFGRRGDLHAEPLDVAGVLNSLREIFVHTLGASIDVRIAAAAGIPRVFADKAQFETVLVNLAVNARDAMPDGGRLTISATSEAVSAGNSTHPSVLAPGRYLRIAVADTGSGMEAATLARALEPFYTTKAEGIGTGLGLPMARNFTEQCGGALDLDSLPGRGTTATLWLPEDVAGRSARAVATAEVSDDTASGVRIAAASARVLVVDDEDRLRELLAQNLEDRGYQVIAASCGLEALALLDAGESADALVTDLSMPGMNGVALIRAAQKLRPELPAVLLTGFVGDEAALVMGGAISGSYALARKPISTNDLVDRIEKLLAAPAGR